MTRMFLWDTTAVHPRIRGERPYTAHASERSAGSSPHTRGTPGPLEFTRPAARFIPAYAGNAWSASSSRARRSVHPRIRGERGLYLKITCVVIRFIPAYAGNAYSVMILFEARSVHPRIRGERRTSRPSRSGVTGSSPHTRGTPITRVPIAIYVRFIPAYAGNAMYGCSMLALLTVHPRIRGERRVVILTHDELPGSSPHTRGTRRLQVPAKVRDRVHPRIRGERVS